MVPAPISGHADAGFSFLELGGGGAVVDVQPAPLILLRHELADLQNCAKNLTLNAL